MESSLPSDFHASCIIILKLFATKYLISPVQDLITDFIEIQAKDITHMKVIVGSTKLSCCSWQ